MPSTSVPLPIVTAADLWLGLILLSPVLIVIATATVVLVVDLIITDWLAPPADVDFRAGPDGVDRRDGPALGGRLRR